MDRILRDLRAGKIKVLFVSPEKLISPRFLSLFQPNNHHNNNNNHTDEGSRMPRIAFVCVDEAHCVSEWSHNFRTSYLRLDSVLRNQLQVKCVLALTGKDPNEFVIYLFHSILIILATATKHTELSICDSLSIPTPSGAIRLSAIRDNLHLSVSRDTDRHKALLALFEKHKRFPGNQPTIIYVMTKVTSHLSLNTIMTNNS